MPHPSATLETPRLILRPLALTDAAEVQPLFAQWEIVKQLNARVPWPFPDNGAETYYREDALPAIERGDEWHWMLRLKDDPDARIIGSICLVRKGNNNRGFWIAREWQGRGLMTEAAKRSHTLLVRRTQPTSSPHQESPRQRRLPRHLSPPGHALHRADRRQLRLRPPPNRNMGAHRRGLAQMNR